jgi:hypothetical protein
VEERKSSPSPLKEKIEKHEHERDAIEARMMQNS